MLASVNLIVVVLVAAAAALAFIVLYNLTNINITERQREIATLKVLGFTPREVDAYIYRETALLSVIGCVLGLVLGVFMEGFVVVTAEVDQVMFGREIHAASFALAFLLTMLFTVLVMLAMRFKLARVNMVESLKLERVSGDRGGSARRRRGGANGCSQGPNGRENGGSGACAARRAGGKMPDVSCESAYRYYRFFFI